MKTLKRTSLLYDERHVATLPHLEPLWVYGDDCVQQILIKLDPPKQIPAIQPVPGIWNNRYECPNSSTEDTGPIISMKT
jgi:hypothetical protein